MTFPPAVLRADAREMNSILRDADCVKRHRVISLDKLSEILTAISTDGEIAGRNIKGFDVLSPTYGYIEVKTRVSGTDGANPRASLTKNKIEKADHFMAVRWSQDFQFESAIMVPAASVKPLYLAKLQAAGSLAHIAWRDFVAAAGRIDFSERFAAGHAACPWAVAAAS